MTFSISDIISIRPQRGIGNIIAQATIEERHTDELQITDHPVEQGAQITDHAFKRPADVVIRCGWNGAAASALLGSPDLLNLNLGGGDKIEETYRKLLELQASRIPFDVLTGKRRYSSMLIKSLSTTTDDKTEHVLFVTITCREILIAKTRATTLPSKSSQKKPNKTGQIIQKGIKQLKASVSASPGGAAPPSGWSS